MLEVNTQPGMTPTSLVPEQAASVGISFPELVAWMVEHAECDAMMAARCRARAQEEPSRGDRASCRCGARAGRCRVWAGLLVAALRRQRLARLAVRGVPQRVAGDALQRDGRRARRGMGFVVRDVFVVGRTETPKATLLDAARQ